MSLRRSAKGERREARRVCYIEAERGTWAREEVWPTAVQGQ